VNATQIRHQRNALTRSRRGLAYHVAIAYHAGDSDTLSDLLAEWQRLTVTIEVLDNWLGELRLSEQAEPYLQEVSRILNHRTGE
jgi:hypothetical protein